jgi:hypothetical protein
MRTAILALALIAGPAFGQSALQPRYDVKPPVQTPRDRQISDCFRDSAWNNVHSDGLAHCLDAAK